MNTRVDLCSSLRDEQTVVVCFVFVGVTAVVGRSRCSSPVTTQQLPVCLRNETSQFSQIHRTYVDYSRKYAAPLSKCGMGYTDVLNYTEAMSCYNASPSRDTVLNTGVSIANQQLISEFNTSIVCVRALAATAENSPQYAHDNRANACTPQNRTSFVGFPLP